MDFSIEGNLVDVIKRKITKSRIKVFGNRIVEIMEVDKVPDIFIIPGIVDAHVHIESSMLVPQEFARLAVKHGTVATVSDPHEIANVLGIEGVRFMLEDAAKVPFKFWFGAPSCVPATSFETSGVAISADEVGELLSMDNIKYLSEMMNYPGVIYEDNQVLKKLKYAKDFNKPVDGHAPGLSGDNLIKYSKSGISTDHESISITEAIEKINNGIKLQIREGSAAKNFEALSELVDLFPDDVMLCTDDCHPDDLMEKHIIDLIRRGVKKGLNVFNLLRCTSLVPVKHYNLNVGLLQLNDCADFAVIDNLVDFNVLETYIDGQKVFSMGNSLIVPGNIRMINNFKRTKISGSDIRIKSTGKDVKVIVAKDGDLYTSSIVLKPKIDGEFLISDIERDILKIVVVNRYNQSNPVIGFIKNIGLRKGAIAQSVAHDSHNIIATGVDDADILNAINLVIENKGGIAAVCGEEIYCLPLPVAGLMSDKHGEDVASKYQKLNIKSKEWGSNLISPFMTLSFMALLVIPELKIGDKGLFNGHLFKLTSLFVD